MTRAHVTESYTNARGQNMRIVGWPSEQPTKTVMVIHHGLGEHIGRYDHFAGHLADMPMAIYGYDAVGHGKSDGKRGDVAGLDQLAEDLAELLPVLLAQSGCERVILFGHSMGAAAVAWYLATHTPHPAIAGVILSSPPVRIHKNFMIRLKIRLGRLLARIAPHLTLSNEIDPQNISSVPAEVDRYLQDPLVHDRLSLELGRSVVDDSAALPDKVGGIQLPLLIYVGLDDGVVQPEGTRLLLTAWGSDDVTTREFPGARHETHHETPEIVSSLFACITEWVTPRLLT